MRSLCICVDILTVCNTFIHFFSNIKYEHSITLRYIAYIFYTRSKTNKT